MKKTNGEGPTDDAREDGLSIIKKWYPMLLMEWTGIRAWMANTVKGISVAAVVSANQIKDSGFRLCKIKDNLQNGTSILKNTAMLNVFWHSRKAGPGSGT